MENVLTTLFGIGIVIASIILLIIIWNVLGYLFLRYCTKDDTKQPFIVKIVAGAIISIFILFLIALGKEVGSSILH